MHSTIDRLLILLLWLLAPAGAQGEWLHPIAPNEPFGSVEQGTPYQGLKEEFVFINRPGQNPVSWYDFQWHYYDLPSPSGEGGGIRLYFYRSEREVAERALPVIRSAFLQLVEKFHYTPTRRIPYILYGSQREFQTTNLFEVSESVLGVTSPADLKMSLPYFGDRRRFREVSTHELVHQFQLQKMMDLAGDDGSVELVDALPLWFIEGMAEYYSKGGLDPEANGIIRDLIWNPDPERHYQVVSFAEDRYRGYIHTYKLGQARVSFIAEVYGQEKLQAYLEATHADGERTRRETPEKTFEAITRRVLDQSLEQVDARWQAWLKRRYYPDFLSSPQDLSRVQEVRDPPSELESYVASPDGATLFVRTIDRQEGRSRLYLFDQRHPEEAEEVAADDLPGLESFHPLAQNILSISEKTIAFAAQDGPGDSLYLQSYQKKTMALDRPPELALGPRHKLQVLHPSGLRFIELSDPALSKDDERLAFVGLTERGQRDLYVVNTKGGTARQLTDDGYDERDLSWGKDGLYYSSDFTDHGRYNLFRLDPETGARTQLTTAAANDRYPHQREDGSLVYSSDSSGKNDLYLLRRGQSQRLTDFTTGLWSPAAAPSADQGVWAQTFHGGRFRLVQVASATWLTQPGAEVPPATAPPMPIPQERFPDALPPYRPYALANWRLERVLVFGGASTNAIAGRGAMLFSDQLRDHQLYVELEVYGSLDYSRALILYQNQARRNAWALGLYHQVTLRFDRLAPTLSFLQRDFGVRAIWRHPLDRFRRLEAELNLGGMQRYCLTDENADSTTSCSGLSAAHPQYSTTADWEQRNGGVNLTLSPVVRFGYDTVRFDPYEGPIDGGSLWVELGANTVPSRSSASGFARLDAERYWRLFERAKLFLRFAGALSLTPNDNSRRWAKSWWLSSADNLRGFYPLDYAFLIGQNYYVANAELHLPLDLLVRILFFEHLALVVAFDFGGVFNRWQALRDPATDLVLEHGAWDSRSFTGVLGLNLLAGPLLFRLHFGHPFDIGGAVTPAMLSNTAWVTNFSLRYFFF